MQDIRQFGKDELFAVKVRDHSVRTGLKVATLGKFVPDGSVRPGFRVNLISTEGVAGTNQVIRFEHEEDAQNWINEKAMIYGYTPEDFSIMKNYAETFVRLPLCDFEEDAWVNAVILNRFSQRAKNNLATYCPEYADNRQTRQTSHYYRGFNF